jgi:hypothetical protein
VVARITVSVAAIAGLVVLTIVLSTSAVVVGVVFGVFAGTVTGLALLNLRRELSTPRQPRQHITHQHLHVYQMDTTGHAEQISEATRTLTTR